MPFAPANYLQPLSYAAASKYLGECGQLQSSSVLPNGLGKLCTELSQVGPGDIYLVYKGVSFDGHVNIAAAKARGAGLIILEDPTSCQDGPWLQVKSGRAAWAWLTALSCGNPQKSLKLVGVTGTNGKTTTVWMTRALLAAAGEPCLAIGTLGAWLGDEYIPTGHTTPDPPLLYALFSAAKERGIRYAAMEVSSHAICQEKLLPLRFDACAFTSFSRDHLDFHKTMEAYWQAKWRLFTELKKPEARCALSVSTLQAAPETVPLSRLGDIWVYGFKAQTCAPAPVQTLEIKLNSIVAGASLVTFETRPNGKSQSEVLDQGRRESCSLPYLGAFALENFAAALLLTEGVLGRSVSRDFFAHLPQVPGRLETVSIPGSAHPLPQIIVDYAHTPDALAKALSVARSFCRGKLWVVFGCGGDRDKGKRPDMGRIAAELADRVVVTSDNPRSEQPERIIADILAGMGAYAVMTEVDRRAAIALAVASAAVDDTILIAGKGHETYQQIGNQRLPFDDRAEAAVFLRKRL